MEDDQKISRLEVEMADLGIETIKFVEDSPEIYTSEDLSFADRYNIYMYEILQDCLSSNVETSLITYIVATVEPIGWQAIWRSTPHSTSLVNGYDFLVEVDDVRQNKLMAEVRIIGVLATTEINVEELKNFTSKPCHEAPLTELFTVFKAKDNGQFDKTALALDNVRFFYDYIWRTWDDEEEEDYIYADSHLRGRLKLFYDLKMGVFPLDTTNKIIKLLQQGKDLRLRMEKIKAGVNTDDLEMDLNEKDVVACVILHHEQDNIRRQLQILENPALSSILDQRNLTVRAARRENRPGDYNAILIVGEKFTAASIQAYMLQLPPESIVEFYNSFRKCLDESFRGDTILLTPGIYTCDDLHWFDHSLTIKGLGQSPADTVIEANGTGDVFINCTAQGLHFSNLKFMLKPTMTCAIMIHHGDTTLENCEIFGAYVGVGIIQPAKAIISNCCIHHAQIAGIEARLGSELNLQRSKIINCGLAGVVLQVSSHDADDSEKRLSAIINESIISFNSKCGLLLNTGEIVFELLTKFEFEVGNTSLFKRFSKHEILVTKNRFEKNGIGDIAVATAKSFSTEPKPEEL